MDNARIKPFLLLFLFLFIIPNVFSLNCEEKKTIIRDGKTEQVEVLQKGTVIRGMCETITLFRSYLGPILIGMIVFAALVYAVGQMFGAETRARATLWVNSMMIAIFITTMIYVIFTEENVTNLMQGKVPSVYFKHIVLALLFGVIWVILFYFPGYFLQHPPLQAAAKEEFTALIMSFIIVIFWVATAQFFSDLSAGIINQAGVSGAGGGGTVSYFDVKADQFRFTPTHLDIAYGSLEIFIAKLKTQYTSLYLFEVLIGFLSTVSFPIGSPLPAVNIISFSLMPYDGLSMLSNAHTVVVEAIGYLMTSMWAKEFIVSFAKNVVPTILFPLGIVMRAFPWYRATGSSLIAICAVVYFIYPLAVIFSNYLVFDVYKPSTFLFTPDEKAVSVFDIQGQTAAEKAEKIKQVQEEQKKEAKHFLEQFDADKDVIRASKNPACQSDYFPNFLCSISNVITGAFGLIWETAKTIGTIWWTMMKFTFDWSFFALGGLPSDAASGLYRFVVEEVINLAQLIVITIVSSVIEIIITITMYRTIAEIIGGEVEIIGLSKIV